MDLCELKVPSGKQTGPAPLVGIKPLEKSFHEGVKSRLLQHPVQTLVKVPPPTPRQFLRRYRRLWLPSCGRFLSRGHSIILIIGPTPPDFCHKPLINIARPRRVDSRDEGSPNRTRMIQYRPDQQSEEDSAPSLPELIASAPWREAKTYRNTWPHEYVLIKRDKQQALLEAFCERIRSDEGIDGRFFSKSFTYLFIGEYKYWTYTPCMQIDLYSTEDDFVLNRARLYRDRRDFIVQYGDKGV